MRDASRRKVLEGALKVFAGKGSHVTMADVAADDPDRLLFALLATFDGLASRISDPRRVEERRHFPDAKITLRMLRPDAEARGRGHR